MSISTIPNNIKKTLETVRDIFSNLAGGDDSNTSYNNVLEQVKVSLQEIQQLDDEVIRLQATQQQQQQQQDITLNGSSVLGSKQGSIAVMNNVVPLSSISSIPTGAGSGAGSPTLSTNNDNTNGLKAPVRARRDRKATIIDRSRNSTTTAGNNIKQQQQLGSSAKLNTSQQLSRSPSLSTSIQLTEAGQQQQGLSSVTTAMDQFKNIPLADGQNMSITIGGGSDDDGDDQNNNNDGLGESQQEQQPEADDDVADWLNDNFADAGEREDVGFDIPMMRRESVVENGELSSPSAKDDSTQQGKTNNQAEAPTASSSSTKNDTAATKVDNNNKAGGSSNSEDKIESADAHRSANISYQRTHQRKTEARIPRATAKKILTEHGISFVPAVHTPDFDIFMLYDEYRATAPTTAAATSRVFLTVAANVFISYSFPANLDFDLVKFFNFLREAERLYAKNPYHNAIHAADVLQSTHMYLCTGDVNNYFSDSELFAVLFAAVIHDLGHLGTNNAFLQNIHHPVAILYNDNCIQESFHTSLGFMMLKNVQCNQEQNNNNQNNTTNNNHKKTDFLTASRVWNEALYRDFRSTVVDIIWGTDMKNHATLMQSAAGILEDNIIEDSEVPSLLRSIVHAADLSNPLKQWTVYIEWAVRVVAEFWRQGDEEARRGLKISPMCDRNGANFAKAQKGFIDFVVRPWMNTLSPVLPKIWLERLEANCTQVAALSQQEIDDIHVRISQHASTPFDDEIMSNVYQMMRKCVSPNMDLFGSLKTKTPVGGENSSGNKNNNGEGSNSNNNNQQQHSSSSSLTPSEVAARLRAQWSDIIKGLTSRGSLSQTAAIVTWATSLANANSRTPFLSIPDSMLQSLQNARDVDEDSSNETKFVSRHLTSNSAEEARSVLSKLNAQDIKDPFSFVRTLNLTVLDMTRPVGSPPRVSVPPPPSNNSNSRNHGNYYNYYSSTTPQKYGESPTSMTMTTPNRMNTNNNSGYSIQKNNNYYQQQLTSFASPPSSSSGNNNTNAVVSGADFNPRRNEVVRFFSEERPIVVPLESRNGPYSSSSVSGNNNNTNNQ